MSAPKCRLCNAVHWANQGHVWPDEPKKAAPKVERTTTSKPVTNGDAHVTNAMTPAQRNAKWRKDHADEYRKRQREESFQREPGDEG